MQRKRIYQVLAGFIVLGFLVGEVSGAEKVKVGTPIKRSSSYFLPMLTAERQGFWKEQGLDGEWIPFRGGTPMGHALASGSISFALSATTSAITRAGRGLPIVIVGDLGQSQNWFLYVSRDSALKSAKDLRGTTFGVFTMGDLSHALSLALAGALGIEKEVKMVAIGRGPAQSAALQRGKIDAVLTTSEGWAGLEEKGVVRRLLPLSDYLPYKKDTVALAATKKVIETKPELVRKTMKVMLRTTDYIMKNPAWAIDIMKQERQFSDRVAREVYQGIRLSSNGRINPRQLEKIRNFVIEYKLVAKEKMPPVAQLYTNKFLPKR